MCSEFKSSHYVFTFFKKKNKNLVYGEILVFHVASALFEAVLSCSLGTGHSSSHVQALWPEAHSGQSLLMVCRVVLKEPLLWSSAPPA